MSSATPSAGSNPAAGSAGRPSVSSTETQPLRQPGTHTSAQAPAPPAVRLERRFQIQFLASEGFMKKLGEARGLLSNRLDGKSLERVFEAMMDEFLERHSPEKRAKRREKRTARRESPKTPGSRKQNATEPAPENGSPQKPRVEGTAPGKQLTDKPGPGKTIDGNTRHIPAKVRDAVYRRDGGRCTYVGTTGRRCGATVHLEIDHIVPYARGGTNSAQNLRLLCGKHNRLEAERVYGSGTMRRYRSRE